MYRTTAGPLQESAGNIRSNRKLQDEFFRLAGRRRGRRRRGRRRRTHLCFARRPQRDFRPTGPLLQLPIRKKISLKIPQAHAGWHLQAIRVFLLFSAFLSELSGERRREREEFAVTLKRGSHLTQSADRHSKSGGCQVRLTNLSSAL